MEQRISIESFQSTLHILSCVMRTFCRTPIRNRSRCWTVSIDAIRAGTQNSNVLVRDLLSASQCKLLIASPSSTVRDLYRDFTARNQTDR